MMCAQALKDVATTKKFSKKINYGVLEDIFGAATKKQAAAKRLPAVPEEAEEAPAPAVTQTQGQGDLPEQ